MALKGDAMIGVVTPDSTKINSKYKWFEDTVIPLIVAVKYTSKECAPCVCTGIMYVCCLPDVVISAVPMMVLSNLKTMFFVTAPTGV